MLGNATFATKGQVRLSTHPIHGEYGSGQIGEVGMSGPTKYYQRNYKPMHPVELERNVRAINHKQRHKQHYKLKKQEVSDDVNWNKIKGL